MDLWQLINDTAKIAQTSPLARLVPLIATCLLSGALLPPPPRSPHMGWELMALALFQLPSSSDHLLDLAMRFVLYSCLIPLVLALLALPPLDKPELKRQLSGSPPP